MKKKMVIILLGAPGAGKGTQAGLLADKLGLYYFETSKILEESFNASQKQKYIEVKGEKYSYAHEKDLWTKGILCSPPFVSYLVNKKIKQLYKAGENLIIAGSPRTLYEGKEVMPVLEKLYGKKNIKIILIQVSAQESIFRNSHRRICELMRHPILYSKATEKLKFCPLDGSKLIKRKGLDDPETIKIRLVEYEKRTLPLVEYFEKRKLNVNKINGKGSVSNIFTIILKALDYKK
jgi:adenylate kinase